MKKHISTETDIYSEIIVLLKLYPVSPGMDAVSERSAFVVHHIKKWLQSTMSTGRLSYCILFSTHKKRTNEINF